MTAFDIEPYSSRGWYLIDGELPANRDVLRVWAILRFSSGERRIPLSASFKGRVCELLPLPREKHDLLVEVEDENGLIPAESLSVKSVSRPVAWRVLWRRVLGSFTGLDQDKAKRLGLNWRTVFSKPFSVYRVLSALRYHYPAPNYAPWREHYWSFSGTVKQRLTAHLARVGVDCSEVPVLVDIRKDLGKVGEPFESQWGVDTRIVKLTDEDDHLLFSSQSEWVLFTRPGLRLEPWALAWFLTEASAHPNAVLVYSDHAHLDGGGNPTAPRFKPDWSPELQRASHYIGDCVLVKTSALKAVINRIGCMPSVYELALELGGTASESKIRHIPAVLWHQTDEGAQADAETLSAHLQRHNIDAQVARDERGHLRIRYGLPDDRPKISIIIPTRDMLHFLQPCVDSILQKTTWPNYEVLILDNQSSCPDTLAYMKSVSADPRVRVLAYDHRFNFSAINNFAVEHATGELVCMLNNDTEVISPDWLDEMASRLLQPGVGAVGARLYFSDGRVQHAGDVVGPGGCANHLHGIIEADDPGYMNRAVLPQELSAVTAACLLTTRSLYKELGGLDEHNLTVAFNDVDFCLRIREAGYRVVYTPYAELYHHESVSRGKDDNPEKQARAKREVQYMRERWADVIERDPYYNPNLNYAKPDFTLGKYPRVDWPW